ncbi:YigZ family protein [Curtobacterium sp. 22159]|uniref:YigZ family protein n=1 Tax=Curtobacterium sp. 22159 TaxID=3453882 RepID=UPI003F850123
MSSRFPSTIAATVEHEIVVTKSRFITTVAPVTGVEDAERVVAEVRRRRWDARHNCTAMVTGVLGDQARSSDDGEPSGTAGVPMLEVLRRRGLTDVVAVVTRYFGGVKLGAGGLVRAYSTSVSEALDRTALVHRRALTRVTVDVPHADAGRIDNVLRDRARHHDVSLGDTSYGTEVTFELWVPADGIGPLRADLAAVSAGALEPTVGEERIVDVPST